MATLELSRAVNEIVHAVKDTGTEGRSPFFFVVGAGISAPIVPLASVIENHCRKEAEQYQRLEPSPSERDIDSYSHWFQQAFPQPSQRQRYLRKLIEGKPVSAANLRLAHLLLNASITNLVVTPNFDDFLSRSMTLFGKSHLVCDHPNTVARIDPERADIQIIHVHGTYWFYDCCNLSDEIVQRAEPSRQTSLTMAALLDNILLHRSPLVIGYSGWEGDVIMSALQRRLTVAVENNVYWFCHRAAEIDKLPKWLRHHAGVSFVIPAERKPLKDENVGQDTASVSASEALSSASDSAAASAATETTLSAQEVLDDLIRALDLPAPALTEDPLAFFAKNLREQLLTSEQAATPDIYAMGKVIQRIESAQILEQGESAASAPADQVLAKVREAVRRSQYTEVIRLVAQFDFSNLEEAGLRELLDAMNLVTPEDSEEELKRQELLVALGEAVSRVHPQDEKNITLMVATALKAQGDALRRLDRTDEAIATYAKVVHRFSAVQEAQVVVAWAMGRKGDALRDAGKTREAIDAYDEVVQVFGAVPEVQMPAAWALYSKGDVFRHAGETQEAVDAYDEVVQRFGGVPGVQNPVAWALSSKGDALQRAGKAQEAVDAYDELLERFGGVPEAQTQVAWALYSKSTALESDGESEKALAVVDELLRRFSNVPAVEFQIDAAREMRERLLGKLK